MKQHSQTIKILYIAKMWFRFFIIYRQSPVKSPDKKTLKYNWLFHKKDYVKAIMQKYNLDILNLQETEIKADLNEKTLLIPGYSLETEKNQHTKCVASYISNSIKYRRRKDLEQDNSHMIIYWMKNWHLYEPSHHGWTKKDLIKIININTQTILFYSKC